MIHKEKGGGDQDNTISKENKHKETEYKSIFLQNHLWLLERLNKKALASGKYNLNQQKNESKSVSEREVQPKLEKKLQ